MFCAFSFSGQRRWSLLEALGHRLDLLDPPVRPPSRRFRLRLEDGRRRDRRLGGGSRLAGDDEPDAGENKKENTKSRHSGMIHLVHLLG